MPRPRRNSSERRRFERDRKARWRQRVKDRAAPSQAAAQTTIRKPAVPESIAAPASSSSPRKHSKDILIEHKSPPLRPAPAPSSPSILPIQESDDDEEGYFYNEDDYVPPASPSARSRYSPPILDHYSAPLDPIVEQSHDRIQDTPEPVRHETSYSSGDERSGSFLASEIDSADERSESFLASEIDSEDEGSIEALLAAQLQGDVQPSPDPQIDLPAALGQQLLSFNGCNIAAHQETDLEHAEADPGAHPNQHVSLFDYTRRLYESNTPLVIDRADFLRDSDCTQEPAPNWAYAFEGRESGPEVNQEQDESSEGSSNGLDANQLCLACSQITVSQPQVSFDIDSFLGFASDLAFARQGLDINLYPRFHTNIQNDLHLYTTVSHDFGRGEKLVRVKLHQVPHYCAGRVLGHEAITFYFFFPRMWGPDKATNFPGRDGDESHGLLRTWTNLVLIPAIFRHIPATSRQHLPRSWDHAQRKSRAYLSERLTRVSPADLEHPPFALYYTLHPNSLAAIWQDIQSQLLNPEYAIYRGVQIFFSSKNTKLRFPYSTLSHVWEAFERPLHAALDVSFLDRSQVWIDVGKETTSQAYLEVVGQLDDDMGPTTYLFRSCCLQSFAQWALLEEQGKSVVATIYPAAMLRDASDITLEMSPSSRKRQEGWVFSQAYNSYKEIFDAAKTKPFSNPYLRQLTWDAAVAQMIQKQGKARLAPDSTLRQSYLASKARFATSLAECIGLSYGTREEHRISLSFFDQMRSSLESTGGWTRALGPAATDLTQLWTFPTLHYLGYLALNTNKFLAAFEWILALNRKGHVEYEHCKLMTMLLQAVPFAFDSGPIMRQQELWKKQFHRRGSESPVLGMGMQSTLTSHGYAWFLPLVDWEQMEFQPRLAHRMAFSSSMLRENYRRNWSRVKDAKDDLARVEAAGRWLGHYQSSDKCVEVILMFLVRLIMRAYRKEIFSHLKPVMVDSDNELYQAALDGDVPLCAATLEALLSPAAIENIHVIDCHRTRVQSIEDLVTLLWGLEGGSKIGRSGWGNTAFRVLCRRSVTLVQQHRGAAAASHFHDFTKRYFIATHWLTPYPRSKSIFQKNQQKQTLWIGVFHRRLAYSRANQHRRVDIRFLLRTVQSQPSYYRPPERRCAMMESKRVQYMEDWDLCQQAWNPIMSQIPEETKDDHYRSGADLETIGELLENMWQEDQG